MDAFEADARPGGGWLGWASGFACGRGVFDTQRTVFGAFRTFGAAAPLIFGALSAGRILKRPWTKKEAS